MRFNYKMSFLNLIFSSFNSTILLFAPPPYTSQPNHQDRPFLLEYLLASLQLFY